MSRKADDSRMQMLFAKLLLQQLGEKLERGAQIGRDKAQGAIGALDRQLKETQFTFSAAMLEKLGALRQALTGTSALSISKAARALRTQCLAVIRAHDPEAHTRGEKRQLLRSPGLTGAAALALAEEVD